MATIAAAGNSSLACARDAWSGDPVPERPRAAAESATPVIGCLAPLAGVGFAPLAYVPAVVPSIGVCGEVARRYIGDHALMYLTVTGCP